MAPFNRYKNSSMQQFREYMSIFSKIKDPLNNYDFSVPTVKPKILNVVASCNLKVELELRTILKTCKNVEYNPSRFAPCVMRIPDPFATCLVFSSGRLVVSGCSSEEDAFVAAKKFAAILKKNVEPSITAMDFEIQNMSSSCKLPFKVDLALMKQNQALKRFVSYEPELFPGLIFCLEAPKSRIVIFCGGAMLITGIKSNEELQEVIKILYPICRLHRKNGIQISPDTIQKYFSD